MDCPPNSVCIRINATNPEDLKCICLEHFQYNPKWQEDGDVEEDEIQHKSTVAATTSQDNYCIPTGPEREDEAVEHKVVVYMRSATNPQHLVFGILMILLGVTLVTAVLYGITALRPIKRTKAVYKKLKNRRQNITPLHEMDELEMNRRFEMQTF